MRIYRARPDVKNYAHLVQTSEEDPLILLHFIGYRKLDNIQDSWKPITVELDSVGKLGDFPALVAYHLTFSERAWNLLYPLMAESVEPLPLRCNSGNYTTIRVVDVVDCLDHSRAVVRRFPSSDRVCGIDYYAFKEGCSGDRNIFTIPEIKLDMFVSQKLKDCVESNELEGLIFKWVD